MSKSILVIDTPTCCADCPLMLWDALSEYYGACVPTLKEVNSVTDEYKENEDRDTRPSWCPLKPMPQKKEVEVNEIEDIMHTGYSIEEIYTNKYIADIRLATDKLILLGWNACLEEILNETV